MNDFSSKYQLLDPNGKEAVNQYIDSLLNKSESKVLEFNRAYKKRILSVSTWEEKDLVPFDVSGAYINNLPVQEW